jgi:hypothetical protein
MPVRTYSFEVPEGPLQDALEAEIRNYALAEKLTKPKSGVVIRKLLAKTLNLEPNQPPKEDSTALGQPFPEEYELELVPNTCYARLVPRRRKEPL